MPTESQIVETEFDLSTSAGGRDYIAHLFKTQLKRHDYTTYINERLAADFACTLARHLEDSKARESRLQKRVDALEAEKSTNWERTRAAIRKHALDDAATVCTRLAHAEYYPSNTRFRYHVPKKCAQRGDLFIKAANAILDSEAQ
ncbi:hypothetical protein [Pseudomonas purpurea]|uniref:hypothetical protein n=1 Tax=Pseudomonas purpurea TaxID=3136737 RepID=UPI00326308E9